MMGKRMQPIRARNGVYAFSLSSSYQPGTALENENNRSPV